MARSEPVLHAFNRGIVSEFGLARVDVDRVALSAALQRNWMPRSLGPMSLRPGLQYVLNAFGDVGQARYLPFVFAIDDTALLEFTAGYLRPLVDEAQITFTAVSMTVVNPDFTVDLSGWTDASDAACFANFDVASDDLALIGTRYGSGRLRQDIAIAPADFGTLHAFRIDVPSGPVQFRVGTAAGLQDVLPEVTLGTGVHVVSFIPTTDISIEIAHVGYRTAFVRSIDIQPTGALTFDTPYGNAQLSNLRFDQSGDVVYLACAGFQQRKLIRRGDNHSWSLELFQPLDGPVRGVNTTHATLRSSRIRGEIDLTADGADVFRDTHVGALFRMESVGQSTSDLLTGDNQFTDPIRVSGIGSARDLIITFAGAYVITTAKLQRSVGEPGSWVNVADYGGGGPFTATYNDGFDNQIIYYRLGIETGDYTSGVVDIDVEYASGSITGVVRITAVSTARIATATVLIELGSTKATENWYEGAWSDYRGWPTCVILYEGRLWWQGKDSNWGSISDEFESFDIDFIGDAGPILRSIGSGPVDSIHWALGLQRMILGGGGAEHSVRSSSLYEPLSPTNYNVKAASTQGSANVDAVLVDSAGLFVQRSKQKVYELAPDSAGVDYAATDMSVLVPEIGLPGIVALGLQRQPDTRIHAIRSDGTAAVLVYDKAENVRAWVEVAFDSPTELIKDFVSLPGDGREDLVYYVVQMADGIARLVRWAQEIECRGGLLNKQADLFVEYSGAPISTLSGLDHLNGRDFIAWADGRVITPAGPIVAGSLDLEGSYSNVVVGLFYKGQYKSGKLGRVAQSGTTLKTRKRIAALGVLLAYTHADGLYYGPDFDTLDPLPAQEDEEDVDPDKIWDAYDKDAFEFNGEWEVDSRLCLEARAPKPCTVLALTMILDEHAKG